MEGLSAGDASVQQLLKDIRDGQREMLELQREAVQHARDALMRTQRMRPFSFAMMGIALVFGLAMPIWTMMRVRPIPMPPARVAPVPVARPAAVPAPRPVVPVPVTKVTGLEVEGPGD